MKKLTFIIAIVIIASFSLNAQIDNDYTETFDSVFANVSYSDATTGML